MTAIHLGEVHPLLDNPEPTATKLGREFGAGVDWDAPAEPEASTVAGIDRGALAAQVGPETAYAPRWVTGSFRVPYGMRTQQLEAFAREMVTRWFAEMGRRGFDIASGSHLIVRGGPNPSRDLATGLEIPGHRDILLSAQFVERRPETVRLEVPGELFDPLTLRQWPTSSGDEGA